MCGLLQHCVCMDLNLCMHTFFLLCPKPRVSHTNLCRFFQNLKIVTKVLTNPLNMLLTLKPLSTGYSNYKHTNALNQLKWMLPCIWRGMVAEVWWQRYSNNIASPQCRSKTYGRLPIVKRHMKAPKIERQHHKIIRMPSFR